MDLNNKKKGYASEYCKYIDELINSLSILDKVIFETSNEISLQNVLDIYNKLKSIEIKSLGIISDIRNMHGMSYIILPGILDHNSPILNMVNMTIGTVITSLESNSCDKYIERFFSDYVRFLEIDNRSTSSTPIDVQSPNLSHINNLDDNHIKLHKKIDNNMLLVLYSRYIFVLKRCAIIHKLSFCMLRDIYNIKKNELCREVDNMFKHINTNGIYI